MRFNKDNIEVCIECFKKHENFHCFNLPDLSDLDCELYTINLERISDSFCEICEIIHTEGNPYLQLEECSLAEDNIKLASLLLNCGYNDESQLIDVVEIQTPTENLFSRAVTIFPNKEIIFDYTTGILREIVISQIFTADDGVSNLLKQKEFIDNLSERLQKDFGTENPEKVVFAIILWLITWLMMVSSSGDIKENFLENGLITIETEDITLSTTTTKIISSSIYNKDGKPLISNQESNRVLKIISKITVNDKDLICEILSKTKFNSAN